MLQRNNMKRPMNTALLFARYQFLRRELETAYRASNWDSGLITRIADDLVETEAALAVQGHPGPDRVLLQPPASSSSWSLRQPSPPAIPALAMTTERRQAAPGTADL